MLDKLRDYLKRLGKKQLAGVNAFIRRPIPFWALLPILLVAATVPTLYGSLNVPSGGTITDTNVSAISCVGTNSGGKYVYNSDCVLSATASPPVTSSITAGVQTLGLTPPGNCITYSSGAIAYNCPTPYPTPVDFTNLVCSGLAACSPSAGPTPAIAVPTPTSANANCSFSSVTLTCSTPTPLPSPTSGNANCTWSGLTVTCSTPTPLPSPTATSTGCGADSFSGVTLTSNTTACVPPRAYDSATASPMPLTMHIEVGTLTNASWTCAVNTDCAFGTYTFKAAFSTAAWCVGTSLGGSTVPFNLQQANAATSNTTSVAFNAFPQVAAVSSSNTAIFQCVGY